MPLRHLTIYVLVTLILTCLISACTPATPTPDSPTPHPTPTESVTAADTITPTPTDPPTSSMTLTPTPIPTRSPISLSAVDALSHTTIRIPESALDFGWLPDSSGVILAYLGSLQHLFLFPEVTLVPIESPQNCTRLLITPESAIIASCESQVVLIHPSASEFRILSDQKPTALALAADGTLLAHGSDSGTITLIDVGSATPLTEMSMTGAVRSLAFSPDGTLLAVASDLSGVWLWDVAAGRSLNALPSGGLDGSLTFSPDNTLLIGQSPSTIRIWFVVSGGVLRAFDVPAPIRSMSLNPSSEILAASDNQNTFYLIDVFTGDVIYSHQLEAGAFPVHWSPDGTALAALGINDDTLHLWTLP